LQTPFSQRACLDVAISEADANDQLVIGSAVRTAIRGHDFSRFRDDEYTRGDTVASMDVERRSRDSVPTPDRMRATRSVWERLSTNRDLQAFLAGVAEDLAPVVGFEGLGAVAFAPDAGFRLLAGWNASVPVQPGETADDQHRRTLDVIGAALPARPRAPYDQDVFNQLGAGVAISCADLLAKDSWYEYEFALAASGMRSYTSLPVFIENQLTGLAVFTRRQAHAFSVDETQILIDAARAIGVAIARALTEEEVGRLRARLSEDAQAAAPQFGHAPFFGDIVGASLALRRALEAIEQVAPTDATVLITGETGTGKELFARGVHQRSRRRSKPFVEINCAAIPETLLASELFGHERGAFTGADTRRQGRFEQAEGGTLFLDEIGELSAEMQVLLLRVLQTRQFQRLGGSTPIRVDVRVVAATNRHLADDVSAGRFRSDLFYRLNVFPVHVPALRERPEDIGVLTAHLAAKYAAQFGRTISRIDRRTLAMLESYDWPGNVRELENLIARAVIVSDGEVLHIPLHMFPGTTSSGNIDRRLQKEERDAIEAALRVSRGRVAGPEGAARRLGLAPSTLESRIQRLGLDKHSYRKR
jgi:transcriptional regulator with GAF, ATPase, and Fis domain